MKKFIFVLLIAVSCLSKSNIVLAQVFDDSNLNAIINSALGESDALKIEYKNIEAAKSYLKLQYAKYYPKLSIQASAHVDLLRARDFDRDTDSSVNLLLDWDIFRNGQILYSIATAKSLLLGAKIKHRVSESDLVYAITRSYFDLFLKEYQQVNLKRKIELNAAAIEEATIAFEQGNIDRVSLTKQKIKLSDEEIDYSQAEYNVVSLKEKLKDKSGIDVNVSAKDIEALKQKAFKVNFDQETLYAMAVRMEPDFLYKKEAKEMAYLASKYAKYRRYPQVQLFTGNSFAVDSFGNSNNQVELRTGIILSYAVFDGGQIKYEIKQAAKNYEKVTLELVQYQDQLKKDIADMCFIINKNKQILLLSEKKLKLLKEDMEHTETEYDKGNISRHKWNTMLLDYESARLKDFSLQIDYLLSIADLFNRLGNFSLGKITDFVSYKDKVSKELAV